MEILEPLFHPRTAFARLRSSPDTRASRRVFLCGWLSGLIGLCLALDSHFSLVSFAVLFLASTILVALAVLARAMAIHFFAEVLGGKGRGQNLLAMMGHTFLPLHVFLPLALITQRAPFILNLLIAFSILIWMASLEHTAIRENYRLSSRKALLASMAPAALVLVLFVLVMTLSVGMIARNIPGLVAAHISG